MGYAELNTLIGNLIPYSEVLCRPLTLASASFLWKELNDYLAALLNEIETLLATALNFSLDVSQHYLSKLVLASKIQVQLNRKYAMQEPFFDFKDKILDVSRAVDRYIGYRVLGRQQTSHKLVDLKEINCVQADVFKLMQIGAFIPEIDFACLEPIGDVLANVMKGIVGYARKTRVNLMSSSMAPEELAYAKKELLQEISHRAFEYAACCRLFLEAICLQIAFKPRRLEDYEYALQQLIGEKFVFCRLDNRTYFAASSPRFFQDSSFTELYLRTNVDSPKNPFMEASLVVLQGFESTSQILHDYGIRVINIDRNHALHQFLNVEDIEEHVVFFVKSSLSLNYFMHLFGDRFGMDIVHEFRGLIPYRSKGYSVCQNKIQGAIMEICYELTEILNIFTYEDRVVFEAHGIDLDNPLISGLDFILLAIMKSTFCSTVIVKTVKYVMHMVLRWLHIQGYRYATNYMPDWCLPWAMRSSSFLISLIKCNVMNYPILTLTQVDTLKNIYLMFATRNAQPEYRLEYQATISNILYILEHYISTYQLDEREFMLGTIFHVKPADTQRYKFLTLVNSGGASKVYKCFDYYNRILVAIKWTCLDMPHACSPENEIKLLIRMKNPYIVRYLDYFSYGSNWYLVMEYCEGRSLDRYTKRWNDRDKFELYARVIGRQILLGLCYLHRHNIVHRDIKPENILLTGRGQVKIADFGDSHMEEMVPMAEKFDLSTLVGTVQYMAPECLHSAKVKTSSDIWSFGCLFLYLITGTRPWSQYADVASILFRLGAGEELPVDLDNLLVSPESLVVLKASLQRDPESRPTALDLLNMHFFAQVEHFVLTM